MTNFMRHFYQSTKNSFSLDTNVVHEIRMIDHSPITTVEFTYFLCYEHVANLNVPAEGGSSTSIALSGLRGDRSVIYKSHKLLVRASNNIQDRLFSLAADVGDENATFDCSRIVGQLEISRLRCMINFGTVNVEAFTKSKRAYQNESRDSVSIESSFYPKLTLQKKKIDQVPLTEVVLASLKPGRPSVS